MICRCSSQAAAISSTLFLPSLGTSSSRLGIRVDDVERFRAKVIDDALGRFRSDAFDQTGPEVLLYAFEGRGINGLIVLYFELFAVFGVIGPHAFDFDALALLDGGKRPYDCDPLALALDD